MATTSINPYDEQIFDQLEKKQQSVIINNFFNDTYNILPNDILEKPEFFDSDFLKKRGAYQLTPYTFENSLGKPAEIDENYKDMIIPPQPTKTFLASLQEEAKKHISEIPNNSGAFSQFVVMDPEGNNELNYGDLFLKCKKGYTSLSPSQFLEKQNEQIKFLNFYIEKILGQITSFYRILNDSSINTKSESYIKYIGAIENLNRIKNNRAILEQAINEYNTSRFFFKQILYNLEQQSIEYEIFKKTNYISDPMDSYFKKKLTAFKRKVHFFKSKEDPKKSLETLQEMDFLIKKTLENLNIFSKKFLDTIIYTSEKKILSIKYRNENDENLARKQLRQKPIKFKYPSSEEDARLIKEKEEYDTYKKEAKENYVKYQTESLQSVSTFINTKTNLNILEKNDEIVKMLYDLLIYFPKNLSKDSFIEYTQAWSFDEKDNTIIQFSAPVKLVVPTFEDYVDICYTNLFTGEYKTMEEILFLSE